MAKPGRAPTNPFSRRGWRRTASENCRGDNHWALCAAADLDDVEVGLLHSVMVDSTSTAARSGSPAAGATTTKRSTAAGPVSRPRASATNRAINDEGRRFRAELERRTDELTAPAWQEVGEATTSAFCEAIEPYHDAIVARIDATAGPRWMPAVRTEEA